MPGVEGAAGLDILRHILRRDVIEHDDIRRRLVAGDASRVIAASIRLVLA
jgi:hypothetical protein